MSLPEPPFPLSSRLSALAQRVGLLGRGSRQVLERASRLRLPFRAPTTYAESICWHNGPALHRLKELPRNALSGPVQEDKAEARRYLMELIEVQQHLIPDLDLRRIDGLAHGHPQQAQHASFESYAASDLCRPVRIISYNDFVKALSQPLPGFLSGQRIDLLQAGWRGERLFWDGERHTQAFASAVAYARLRGLDTRLPAAITQYSISGDGLRAFQQRYHALAMPGEAWSDADFMQLLMEHDVPYARLNLLQKPGSLEFLLLPKSAQQASALGEGLRLAGAPDMLQYLHELTDGQFL